MQRVYSNSIAIPLDSEEESSVEIVGKIIDKIDAWKNRVMKNNGVTDFPLSRDESRHEEGTFWMERIHEEGSSATYFKLTIEHDCLNESGRRWKTQIELGSVSGLAEFNIKILTGFQAGVIRPQGSFLTSQPKIIADLTEEFVCLRNGAKVPTQETIFSEKDAEEIAKEIINPDRVLPVIFVNNPESDLIDAEKLAYSTRGLATVVSASDEGAVNRLRNMLSTKWVPRFPHVRIYWPNFNINHKSTSHVLYRERVLRQRIKEGANPQRVVALSIYNIANRTAMPNKITAQARRAIVSERFVQAKNDGNQAKQIEMLEQQCMEKDEKIKELEAQNESLIEHFKPKEYGAEATEEIPFDQEAALEGCVTAWDVVQIAEDVLDHIEVLDSTRKAAEKDRQNPRMKNGVWDAVNAINELCESFDDQGKLVAGDVRQFFEKWESENVQSLPKFAPSDGETARNKYKKERTVLIDGKKEILRNHFTIGTGSPDENLNLYFHVDPLERRAIIGYLGRHLSSAKY